MKFNKRFNVFGTIGNCHELRAVTREEPTHSYHVIVRGFGKFEEVAIRYTHESAIEVAGDIFNKEGTKSVAWVMKKPILREFE